MKGCKNFFSLLNTIFFLVFCHFLTFGISLYLMCLDFKKKNAKSYNQLVWKEIKSLWSDGSPFTPVQMHPEHLLHVLRTICSGWWKLCCFSYTEHLEDVFQDICRGQALCSLLQPESMCSQGWTSLQIS